MTASESLSVLTLSRTFNEVRSKMVESALLPSVVKPLLNSLAKATPWALWEPGMSPMIFVSGGERLGHFGGPFWATPFPLARGSQNGPRPQGFASPRNNGAPLTAAGRSERTPHSKRERVRAESYQTAALLAPFSTAIDISRLTVRSAAG